MSSSNLFVHLAPLYLVGLFRPRSVDAQLVWTEFLASWKPTYDLDSVLSGAIERLSRTLPCASWYAYVAHRQGGGLQLRVATSRSGSREMHEDANGLLVLEERPVPGIWPAEVEADACSISTVGSDRYLTVACGAQAVLCGELAPRQRVGRDQMRTAQDFGRFLGPLVDLAVGKEAAESRLEDARIDAAASRQAMQTAFRFDRSLSLLCHTGAETVASTAGYLVVWDETNPMEKPAPLWQHGDAEALRSAIDLRELRRQAGSGQALHWREPMLPTQVGRLGIAALTVIPLVMNKPRAGAIVFGSRHARLDEKALQEMCAILAKAVSEVLTSRAGVEQVGSEYLGTMVNICDLLDTTDSYNVGHSRQVSGLCRLLAVELGQPPAVIDAVGMAGRLHDLGMVAISMDLPLKRGTLSEAERKVVQRHASIGADLLTGLPPAVLPTAVVQAVRHHHERWDGRGYPDGLSGEHIPLEARIVAGAEQFLARQSARSYRAALRVQNALFLVQRLSETELDPRVAAALVQIYEERGIHPEPLGSGM